MRVIGSALETAQELNDRYPISKISVYDSMLRWSELAPDGAFSIDSITGTTVPGAPFDADIYDGEIWVCEAYGDNVYSDMFEGEGFIGGLNYHGCQNTRPSVYRDNVFMIEDLYDDPVCVSRSIRNATPILASAYITATPYETEQWHALAAINEAAFYHAFLAPSGSSDSDYTIGIEYVSSASDTSPDVMDYSIPVPTDYTGESLSWFDAVRLSDGTDVIVVNTETYGKPEVIVRRNGVWGDRTPIVPTDVVDNYSYLRIGWMKVYNDVIYATGELGRSGSTGRHAQSMAVVLRSVDGLRWTLDRWRYLGQTPLRSPLLMDSAYAYLFDMPNINYAPLTPIFGLQDESAASDTHVFFDIDTDILRWEISAPNDREIGLMSLQVNDSGRTYSSPTSPCYLRPGYMLRVYAGYKTAAGDQLAQVGWYGIDTTLPVVGSGTRALNIACREWNMRSLIDNAFDQDWQWLSQTMHYDDCDQRDYLYSIAGAVVRPINDTQMLESETADAYEGDANLKVYEDPDKTILVSTVPFEATDGYACAGFYVDGAYCNEEDENKCNFIWKLGLNEYGLGYDLSEKRIGIGAGAAIIKDEHNFIVNFLDVRTRQLILLSVVASDSSDEEETWSELAKVDMSEYIGMVWVSPHHMNTKLYEPWIDVRGNTINYGVMFSQTSPWIDHDPSEDVDSINWTTIDEGNYYPNNITCRDFVATNVPRHGENRLGIVVGTATPYVRLSLHPKDDPLMIDNFYGRSLYDYNNGESIGQTEDSGHQPYYDETSTYEWADFRNIQIGRSGWAYVEGNPTARGLLTTPSTIDGTNIPMSPRGDFVTGYWGIQSTASDINGIEIQLDPDDCWPPGGDSGYWLGEFDDDMDNYTYGGFWFMDGDLEGRWLRIYSVGPGDGGNVKFVLFCRDETHEVLPSIGDNVIYCPGAQVSFFSPEYTSNAARIFWNPVPVGVTLRSFVAADIVREKSIQFALDDIICKAGILDTIGGLSDSAKEYSLDQDLDADGKHVLTDEYKNFDFQVALSEPISAGNIFTLQFGIETGSPSDETDYGSVALDYNIEAEEFLLTYMSRCSGEYATHLEKPLGTTISGAENFRFVKKGEFVSVWAEERLLASYPFRKRWEDVTFSDSILEYGSVSFNWVQSAATYNVKQEKLWSPIDGVIGGQGGSALQLLGRVIKDARIKVLADENLTVRTSVFDSRDDAGTVPDVIFNDQQALTDNLPTHIRVIGTEIGEYFDHAAMAEYGVRFAPRTVESFDEDEAFDDAQRAIKDFVGANHGRNEAIAAQMQLEPEDGVLVDFESLDGQVVSDNYVINSIRTVYSRATLEMFITLREDYGS